MTGLCANSKPERVRKSGPRGTRRCGGAGLRGADDALVQLWGSGRRRQLRPADPNLMGSSSG